MWIRMEANFHHMFSAKHQAPVIVFYAVEPIKGINNFDLSPSLFYYFT